jgi:glutamate synthase (ferredoxin)
MWRKAGLAALHGPIGDVYPTANVLGEKDACGVGMIANLRKPANHELLQDALRALSCVEHRGACSSGMDSTISLCGGDDSGDGAGVMTQIPWNFLASEVELPSDRSSCALGMLFLSKDPAERIQAKMILEKALIKERFQILGYRIVPVDSSVLGARSALTEPWIEQIIVTHAEAKGQELETLLYIARKRTEAQLSYDSLYVASLSSRTVVYKGMLKSQHLIQYYRDLTNPRYEIQYALCTAASAPTPCRGGHLPSPSESSATTVRSTRFRATIIGRMRALARSSIPTLVTE